MNAFRLLITKRISPRRVKELEHTGIEVVENEFIEITLLDKCKEIKRLLHNEAVVVFTSRNAVQAVVSCKDQFFANWKIYCTDGATREAVTEGFGEIAIEGSAPDAKMIASVMLSKNKYKKIVFFCGDKRRNELPDILKKNGVEVEEITVYETRLSPKKVSGVMDGVVFFSPSAVESFFSVNTIDHATTCFSIGETTSGSLKKYTGNTIITSNKASEGHMVETVLKYYQSISGMK